jgi:LmbE family N-acetylglucosaminyl deacetylase
MHISPERILVLAPHPDDGEFGCGGALARFMEKGAEVHYIAFSPCEESLPEGFAEDHLRGELMAAMKALGVPDKNVTLRDYPVRRFAEHRQDILEELVKDRAAIDPDLVFLPSQTDFHQDHQVIAIEGLRAFKHCSLLAYELPWNTFDFRPTVLCELEEKHVALKAKALSAYKSQKFRPYFKDSFVRSLARVRGTQMAVEFAEAFEVPRLVV